MAMLLRWSEFALGLAMFTAVLWDGFATIVLPRTVAPMRRLSGRFTRWSWRFWAVLARRIGDSGLRLTFLSVYGPLSVMVLLGLWALLMIVGFALMYQGLGPRLQSPQGLGGFGTLLYMSGSTFLTLGLGDVTTLDSVGRTLILIEAGSGYIFLALIITYMPLLDQAYGVREVGNVLIHSRVGRPPSAIRFLHRYASSASSEILRGNLREAERWMADILQSHLSHPVLSFYRAQHQGQFWLVALATLLDSCSLLIVGAEGLLNAQARLTYRMGLRLLADLANALSIPIDPHRRGRLNEADLPALIAASEASGLGLLLDGVATEELLRLVHRYDVYLLALADWLVVPLPAWIPPAEGSQDTLAFEVSGEWNE